MRSDLENVIQILSRHAWDGEVQWAQVVHWLENFNGEVVSKEEEQLYALYMFESLHVFRSTIGPRNAPIIV